MKVGIVGAGGRMGRLLVQLAHEADIMTVAAASELPGSPFLYRDAGDSAGVGPIGVVVGDSAEAVFEAADIVIEFSVPQATADHAAFAAKHGTSYVTGTTGLDPAQEAALAEAGKTVPILYAPNMSVAVVL